MEIKVGSKWEDKHGSVIEVKGIVDNEIIVFKNVNKDYGLANEHGFIGTFKPHQQFKWLKPTNITIKLDGYSMVVMPEDMKSYELKLNYDRYHKQCDNVEFEHNDIVWNIDNETVIIDEELCDIGILTPKFSTEEHAETFLQLAEENDCL